MDTNTFKVDLLGFLKSPNFIFRAVSLVFCIIILACIDRDGYFLGQCLFYSGGSACSFALSVASFGLIFCLVLMGIDAVFLNIPQPYRRYISMCDLGFSGFWTFIYFVLFCYMANHWQRSDANPDYLQIVNLNNVRASIAFAFFSIFTWAGMTYTAYRRYNSIQDYTQYPDDITETNRDQRGVDAAGGSYIDYFNHPNATGQTGFDASAGSDDEFIVGGQQRAGDADLLTS